MSRGIQKLTSWQFPEWSICIPNNNQFQKSSKKCEGNKAHEGVCPTVLCCSLDAAHCLLCGGFPLRNHHLCWTLFLVRSWGRTSSPQTFNLEVLRSFDFTVTWTGAQDFRLGYLFQRMSHNPDTGLLFIPVSTLSDARFQASVGRQVRRMIVFISCDFMWLLRRSTWWVIPYMKRNHTHTRSHVNRWSLVFMCPQNALKHFPSCFLF